MSENLAVAETTEAPERRDPGQENRLRRSIFEVPVKVSVSLGSCRMKVREIMELEPEAVVPLEAGIEDPVELIVDGKIIAYGELKETEDGGLAVVIVEIAHGDPKTDD